MYMGILGTHQTLVYLITYLMGVAYREKRVIDTRKYSAFHQPGEVNHYRCILILPPTVVALEIKCI